MGWLAKTKHYLGTWGDHTDPTILREYNAPWNFFQMGLGNNESMSGATVAEICENIIASTISEFDFQHITVDEHGTQTVEKQSGAGRVLRNPNNHTTKSIFFYQLVKTMLEKGNGYAFAKRDKSFRIASLHNSVSMSPMINACEDLVIYGEADDGIGCLIGDGLFVDRDVLNYRTSPLYSQPLLGVAMRDKLATPIAIAGAISQSDVNYYSQGRANGAYISTDMTLDADKVKALRDRMDELVSGSKIPMLTSGMKILTQASNDRDKNNVLVNTQQRDTILAAYRVPKAVFGDFIDLSFSSSDNINQLWVQGLTHHVTVLEEQLTKLFGLDGVTSMIHIDMEKLLIPNSKDKAEMDSKRILAGVRTPNEVRAESGLKPIDGGNSAYMQSQNSPISMLGQLAENQIANSGKVKSTKTQGLFNV